MSRCIHVTNGHHETHETLRIAASLLAYEQQTKRGHAFGDSAGFIVNLPHRRSFGPDVAFYTQPLTDRFVEGAPLFAVEVRSRDEYGRAAERPMAEKRADYLAFSGNANT